MKKIIVVNNPKEWNLGVSDLEVMSSRDYLTHSKFATMRNVRVFNLARSYSYQSRGYYVSLLAEARGHKVIPNVKTILDLRSLSIVKVLSRDLDAVSYTHLRAHETVLDLVCRLLLEKKNKRFLLYLCRVCLQDALDKQC